MPSEVESETDRLDFLIVENADAAVGVGVEQNVLDFNAHVMSESVIVGG